MKRVVGLLIVAGAAVCAALVWLSTRDPALALLAGAGCALGGLVLVGVWSVVWGAIRVVLVLAVLAVAAIAVVAWLESKGLVFAEPVVGPWVRRHADVLAHLLSVFTPS